MRATARTALLVLAAAALAAFAGSASAQNPLPASYYGGGLEAGAVVTASIGGAECGSATADADGGWSITVNAGDCGGGAAGGATVAFAINGAPAEQTAPWEAGWRPDDPGLGIALTLAPPRPSATFGGGGLDAGVVVAASIGGVACGEAEAGADGRWTIAVREGGCYGGAVRGAAVSFTLDGIEATPGATWRPGGADDDIALTAAARKPSAMFRGGGIGTGVVVAASIRGVACGEAAAGADGRWTIAVREGDCGGGAADGAVVSFTLDGIEARPKAAWEAAGVTAVALTADWTTLALEGARAAYVQDTDGGIASYVVGAPDFVNAAFVRRWVVDSEGPAAGPALTLGIEGARALYVQGADGAIASYVVGAPDFVNAAFARRWIADAIE